MDFFEAQELFKNMYPGKKVDFNFDDNCIRAIELMYTDGKPNESHHLEYRKVRVDVEGNAPVYISIFPHRMALNWDECRKCIGDLHQLKV